MNVDLRVKIPGHALRSVVNGEHLQAYIGATCHPGPSPAEQQPSQQLFQQHHTPALFMQAEHSH